MPPLTASIQAKEVEETLDPPNWDEFRRFAHGVIDDTVEWLAKQPWSTGKIGTFGSSQAGFAQNFLAVTQPPRRGDGRTAAAGPPGSRGRPRPGHRQGQAGPDRRATSELGGASTFGVGVRRRPATQHPKCSGPTGVAQQPLGGTVGRQGPATMERGMLKRGRALQHGDATGEHARRQCVVGHPSFGHQLARTGTE